ncbi:gag/pol protein [Cucumis melo var. makuwa]|uniref:Gag/pol protein n=1 Tax=Cucumis melo var. makuwa TaxID=1194695 RepID=A0A5D3CWH0_CUCMM|nr:gag/pol protein [Cucumis melo var. makuwa]
MKKGTSFRKHVRDMMIVFNITDVNGRPIDEANQVSFILQSLSNYFIPFQTNASLNKIEFKLTTLLNELQRFSTLTLGKGKELEANVAVTKKMLLRGLSSKNIVGPSKPKSQMKKKRNGKTPKMSKAKKGADKGKCFHYN